MPTSSAAGAAPTELVKGEQGERTRVLERAGHPDDDRAGRQLDETTRVVLERYDGDLQRLRPDGGDREDRAAWCASSGRGRA